MQEKLDIFKKSEESEFVRYPTGNLIREDISNENITFKIENTFTQTIRVGILDGGYNTQRTSPIVDKQNCLNHNYDGNFFFESEVFKLTQGHVILNDNALEIDHFELLGITAFITNAIYAKQYISEKLGKTLIVSSEKSIDLFRKYQQSGAYRISQIHIQSNNVEQYSQIIGFSEANPFRKGLQDKIVLENYYKPENQINKKIIVDYPINVSPHTIMYVDIPANTITSFTFNFSAFFDSKKALEAIIKPQILQRHLK